MSTTESTWRQLSCPVGGGGKRISLDDVETVLIDAAIKRADGNLSSAARLLGISRAAIGYRLKKRES